MMICIVCISFFLLVLCLTLEIIDYNYHMLHIITNTIFTTGLIPILQSQKHSHSYSMFLLVSIVTTSPSVSFISYIPASLIPILNSY